MSEGAILTIKSNSQIRFGQCSMMLNYVGKLSALVGGDSACLYEYESDGNETVPFCNVIQPTSSTDKKNIWMKLVAVSDTIIRDIKASGSIV